MKHIEVVAAVIHKNNLYLATQRGYGEYKGWWEFPGGKIEKGEEHQEALEREIKEELNAEISIDKFLCTVEYTYPHFHLTMHCYLCQLQTEIILKEHLATRWLNKHQLLDIQWLPADISVVEQLQK